MNLHTDVQKAAFQWLGNENWTENTDEGYKLFRAFLYSYYKHHGAKVQSVLDLAEQLAFNCGIDLESNRFVELKKHLHLGAYMLDAIDRRHSSSGELKLAANAG